MQQRFADFPGRGPGAVLVAVGAAMTPDPLVEQRVAGAGVETGDGPGRGQLRHIGDAADIHDRAIPRRRMKQPLMKRRYEWSALPAGDDVARAKIRDRRDAGAFGDHRRVADLRAKRIRPRGTMAHGLSVTADGADIARL